MLPPGRSKAVPSLQRKEVSECNHTPRMNHSVVPLTLATHLSEHECHLGLVHQWRIPRPPLRQSCNTTDTVNMPTHTNTSALPGNSSRCLTAMSSAPTPNSSATLPLQSCSTHHHYDTAAITPDTHTIVAAALVHR